MITNRLAMYARNAHGYEFNPTYIPEDRVIVSPLIQYPRGLLDYMAFISRLMVSMDHLSGEDIKILN